ncbi:MAG: acyl carrier protein [Saccharofermentans sp.]|jgi:acyl carrier protein|nr:acyl carrier protein [Saccharofermentans sp.]
MMTDPEAIKKKIYDDVLKILSGTLEMSPEDIPEDLGIDSGLPFDSLQLYEFVIDLEEAYNIKISDEALDGIKDIGGVVDLVYDLTTGNTL